jgi:hypothetical protein
VPVFALGVVLSFLSCLLPLCLLPFLSEDGGQEQEQSQQRGRVRIKTIGHGVVVRVVPKARGGGVKIVEEGMVGVEGNRVALSLR